MLGVYKITAIATARTTNWTNRMISRVNRKKSATIPTIPRNNGPKRPCKYETRPFVLSDSGAAAISEWNDIVLLRGWGLCVWGASLRSQPGARSRLPRGLGGWGNALDIPGTMLPHNGQRIGHLEVSRRVSRPRSLCGGRRRDFPDDGGNYVTDGAADRCRDAGDGTEHNGAAQAGHRRARREESAEGGLITARVRLEKVGKLPHQLRFGCGVGVDRRRRGLHGGLRHRQPRGLSGDPQAARGSI